jgi:hypothetical protein
MTQEQKDLLFKDLSARLPYHVKVKVWLEDGTTEEGFLDLAHNYADVLRGAFYYNKIKDIKPYLFPISSMNEEQKREYNYWKHEVPVGYYEYGDIVEKIELFDSPESFQYLIENHFDYHGLIERGFAIDATGKNIY